MGLIPWLGKSPGERNSNLLQYSCLGNSMDRGACRAKYSPWRHRESQATEHAYARALLEDQANSQQQRHKAPRKTEARWQYSMIRSQIDAIILITSNFKQELKGTDPWRLMEIVSIIQHPQEQKRWTKLNVLFNLCHQKTSRITIQETEDSCLNKNS